MIYSKALHWIISIFNLGQNPNLKENHSTQLSVKSTTEQLERLLSFSYRNDPNLELEVPQENRPCRHGKSLPIYPSCAQ